MPLTILWVMGLLMVSVYDFPSSCSHYFKKGSPVGHCERIYSFPALEHISIISIAFIFYWPLQLSCYCYYTITGRQVSAMPEEGAQQCRKTVHKNLAAQLGFRTSGSHAILIVPPPLLKKVPHGSIGMLAQGCHNASCLILDLFFVPDLSMLTRKLWARLGTWESRMRLRGTVWPPLA